MKTHSSLESEPGAHRPPQHAYGPLPDKTIRTLLLASIVVLATISFLVLLLVPAVAEGVSCGTVVRPVFAGWAGEVVYQCEQLFGWRWAGMVMVWGLAVMASFLVIRDPQFADDATPLGEGAASDGATKEFVEGLK